MEPATFFIKHGVRISVKAEALLKTCGQDTWAKLLELKKPFISEEDVKCVLAENADQQEKKIVVIRARERVPAEEHEPDIEHLHTKEITGKSRGKGRVEDFVSLFRDRFVKLRKLFPPASGQYSSVEAEDLAREEGNKVRLIGMVYEIRETKNKNLLIEVEDLTGKARVIISRQNESLFEKARKIITDEVLAFSGVVRNGLLIADELDWPDIPIRGKPKVGRRGLDLAIAYLSDLHFGSKQCLWPLINKFIAWLHGKTSEKKLYKKVKYVVVAGDVVDGIGIYPGQEEDLEEFSIERQYRLFNNFVEALPEHIEVIVLPGNHDAVRRAEPMPALPKDMVYTDVLRVGNPSWVRIEGLLHLLYHGTSIDSMIANIPGLEYSKPEKAMIEYLRRRHLSPIYGGNLIVPELVDYFVIDEVPDVLHCGHIHKNGYALYRGVHVINSGTFQDQTDYQKQQGHVPTPGIVPYLETNTSTYTTVNLYSI